MRCHLLFLPWQIYTSVQSRRFADQPYGYHALSETTVFQLIVSYPLNLNLFVGFF